MWRAGERPGVDVRNLRAKVKRAGWLSRVERAALFARRWRVEGWRALEASDGAAGQQRCKSSCWDDCTAGIRAAGAASSTATDLRAERQGQRQDVARTAMQTTDWNWKGRRKTREGSAAWEESDVQEDCERAGRGQVYGNGHSLRGWVRMLTAWQPRLNAGTSGPARISWTASASCIESPLLSFVSLAVGAVEQGRPSAGDRHHRRLASLQRWPRVTAFLMCSP